MDVADFASSIIALKKLIELINVRVNGRDTEISVGIQRVEQGSLIVTIQLALAQGKKLAQIGNSPSATGLNTILAILLGSGTIAYNLFNAIAALGGNPDKDVKKTGDQIFIDNSRHHYTVVVTPEQYSLAKVSAIRNQAAKVIQPLEKNGVDGLYLRRGPEDVTENDWNYKNRITKEDLYSFPVPSTVRATTEEKLLKKELTKISPDIENVMVTKHQVSKGPVLFSGTFAIANVPFHNLKAAWQLIGNQSILAYIHDEEFLQRIRDRSLTLGENDVIEAEVIQRFEGSTITYEVVRVIQHLPGGKRTLSNR
jgi:hypothetical protein